MEVEEEEEKKNEEEVESRQSDGRAEKQRNLRALQLIYIPPSVWGKKKNHTDGAETEEEMAEEEEEEEPLSRPPGGTVVCSTAFPRRSVTPRGGDSLDTRLNASG